MRSTRERFEVHALLAHGSRVDTYDVTDPDRDCRAVLKVLRPDRADEPHVVAALRTEGELLTTLAHPHLVRGYEVLDDAVLLETLPGRTLAALVDDGPLGVHDTALVGRQLASVLGYLHRHGWLHLDVKPENVVVQEGRVVLIDLGLATRPGRLERSVGTEGYAAPEQDAGCTVGPATDVWGLGVTLAECLEGRDARPLTELVADCCRTDPAERASVAEVAARLDAVLAAPPRLSWWRSRRPR